MSGEDVQLLVMLVVGLVVVLGGIRFCVAYQFKSVLSEVAAFMLIVLFLIGWAVIIT